MKTTNYESIATNVVKRLNDKFGEKIFFITGTFETYCLIQNLYYDYEGNDVGIMISDEGIEGSITGMTVKFDSVDELIDRIDELFGKENKAMKKQIDVFLTDKKIDVWNEEMNRWEKCSFDEAGIEDDADANDIEIYLREEYQEKGYEDITISFN